MAVFRPIARPTDLPQIGTARETGTYDFKASADPTNQRELAKDVASFANAFGGVLLVGAVEDDAARTLKGYSPMTRQVAERLASAYEQAVRDRCEPQAIFDAVPIELPASRGTGFVVAVTVRAMALGPVGVRWDTDKSGSSFRFPLRTTTHTHHMTPTEVAMFMIPEVRRVAIMLDAIPPDERKDVLLVAEARSHDADTRKVTIIDVDRDLTTLRVRHNSEELSLPLDRVSTVWRRDQHRWGILLRGRIEFADGSLVVLPG